jgi:hypothetical protein
MKYTKEKALQDLGLEATNAQLQDQVVAQFFTLLTAKIQHAIVGRMSDEQKENFSKIESEDEQDLFMEEVLGDEFETVVDSLYEESVAEFKATVASYKKGMGSSED